ncbi:homolog to carboxylate-amine ligase (plasmid) [Natronomonas pharaonis DSM 2160]|uniref:Homolog to carboxylate-amine ligase n=1 Tax=Natronomonas pharaonis (strain ATCC 35678 / DSM 2160 / CIP 103997 / JCM 8858 / NBRC 14720 / NCIMB 2260 / Gabara) TaxID=348780 RepID=Q3ILW1_NATPD|nr:glutamate-cysteine ligase family protein [Natronomonas pharaonis]CAI50909.1 homolog to carboxylate-amine ligase [Natronomonas pharaonis DSM 2160]
MSESPDTHRSPNRTTTTGSASEGEPIRRSIEVEYWVVDGEGRLTEPEDLVDASPGVEREFVAPLLEIKTTPCETTAQLREELFTRLERVLQRAKKQDKGLVPLGTPIYQGLIEDLPSERTRIQDRILGEDFEYVRHCAGTHIHVEQQPGRKIDQLNALIAIDPALALVNSSPYFEGTYLTTGARSQLYRWMAYNSLPHQGRLWSYIEDTAEWEARLERRYEEFVAEGVTAEVDRETTEACFDPESSVWTPVQLREEFSTVEWRSPDTALPSQIVRLADDIVDLIDHLRDAEVRIEGDTGRRTEDAIVLPEFSAVEEYVERAVRHGLSSDAVRQYLDRMGFNASSYAPLTHQIDAGEELTVAKTRELRLEYAERLEQDLSRARSTTVD